MSPSILDVHVPVTTQIPMKALWMLGEILFIKKIVSIQLSGLIKTLLIFITVIQCIILDIKLKDTC